MFTLIFSMIAATTKEPRSAKKQMVSVGMLFDIAFLATYLLEKI